MFGEGNMDNSEQPVDLIANLKVRRATAKAAVTRTITAIDKLMAVDSNHVLVKERMTEFNQLLQEFTTAHNEYVHHLTTDDQRSEADEYWRKAIAPVDEFSDIVGAWIAELDELEKDEHQDENNDDEIIDEHNDDENDYEHQDEQKDDDADHDKKEEHKETNEMSIEISHGNQDESSLHQSLIEQTLHHNNAALEAKVQAVKRQQALEMEAFELETKSLKSE